MSQNVRIIGCYCRYQLSGVNLSGCKDVVEAKDLARGLQANKSITNLHLSGMIMPKSDKLTYDLITNTFVKVISLVHQLNR